MNLTSERVLRERWPVSHTSQALSSFLKHKESSFWMGFKCVVSFIYSLTRSFDDLLRHEVITLKQSGANEMVPSSKGPNMNQPGFRQIGFHGHSSLLLFQSLRSLCYTDSSFHDAFCGWGLVILWERHDMASLRCASTVQYVGFGRPSIPPWETWKRWWRCELNNSHHMKPESFHRIWATCSAEELLSR